MKSNPDNDFNFVKPLLSAYEADFNPVTEIRRHYQLLCHEGYGVTELRVFDGKSMVAYVDNENDFARLVQQMDGTVSGIYVGVQPRPPHLFELAPNCWQPARGQPHSNCARDRDIEYITLCFMDLDVISDGRLAGHPATDEELEQTCEIERQISHLNEFAGSTVTACSGNGHYLLIPIVPIIVDSDEIAI